jgi:hypothetical protein
MTEPHVVTALRAKRAEISGHVADLERKLVRHRANLANIDATIRLFAPGHGLDETEASVTNKLSRGTFPATFFLATLAAIGCAAVSLEDI